MSEKIKQFKEDIAKIKEDVEVVFEKVKTESKADLIINDVDLDQSIIAIPKIYSKYLDLYTDESVKLKNLYQLREKVRLERWKYYSGKQTDKYNVEHGILHEKILKGDIDKYMSCDVKLMDLDSLVHLQKQLVDYLEKVLKEVGNRNFHIKAIIDYRKFIHGY